MKRDLRYERFYPHPPERVWFALTDSRALAVWYMENDFQAVVGHHFQFRTQPGLTFDGVLSGEVLTVEPPHKLAYTFIGGSMTHPTTITWTLTPMESGTRLVLEHTGFTGLANIAISGILGLGWRRFLKRLPPLLERLRRESHFTQAKEAQADV